MLDGSGRPFGGFQIPKVRGRASTAIACGIAWFWVMYRMKHDGPHHFLHEHPWEKPEMLAHLEEVDKKWGTKYATDNMHHH
ncbi:hypothetical protein SmJEL517_g00789 [Synchytrium microbalum]|uniref:Uncharacterized protein n=1 Tax=Synchytrium microbalum TaxID=1806994 RepID=A0A507CBY0_9FUNG|nr:uncharacterized protein SmJEL517_g00789 [Synchytrium microbalum]TPX37001.1 hypothetical protein SmJEL517_g00789 [Synchytrium microbalum]